MSFDEVSQIVAEGDEAENARPGCKAGSLRELPLPIPAPDIKRYFYTSSCGGSMDQATFHFLGDRLIKYYFYFNRDYFKGIEVKDFIEKVKGLYGESTYEKWLETGIQGSIVWKNNKCKVTLEFFGSVPFVLKIEEVAGSSSTQSQEGTDQNDNPKRLEGVVY